MFSTIILAITIFALSFLSPESIAMTIAGFIVTLGLTQIIKNASGLQRVGALILAIVVSFVVAVVALFVSAYFGGEGISLDNLAQLMPRIFALATIVYKVLADLTSDED